MTYNTWYGYENNKALGLAAAQKRTPAPPSIIAVHPFPFNEKGTTLEPATAHARSEPPVLPQSQIVHRPVVVPPSPPPYPTKKTLTRYHISDPQAP